jgi:ubiquinone/menaquinone biosynthesis C-methylase UbiE
MPNDNFYSFGYGPSSIAVLDSRSAKTHAGFFLDALTSEMRILDVGCGPGSITVGIADTVKRGNVIGIDIESSQIEFAKQKADEL